jgi:hypothetical protein
MYVHLQGIVFFQACCLARGGKQFNVYVHGSKKTLAKLERLDFQI